MISLKGIKCKFWVSSKKVKKMYLGAKKVFSAGNWVTYNIDSGTTYSEEWDEGLSVLTPTTFTPTKTDWIFYGWRETLDAISNVLSSKIMGEEPITLYGVFKKLVTLTIYNNSTSADEKTGYKYYNNENITNPSFTISPSNKSGWAFLGWTKNSSATGEIAYTSITNKTFENNETLYGKYSKNVTLSYDGNGATSGSVSSQTSPAYYNSSGDTQNPTFTIKPNSFEKTNHSFVNWALDSVNGDEYSSGSVLNLGTNARLYAIWKEVIKDIISFTSWNGYTSVTDNPQINGDSGTSSTNNCSIPIDVTNFNTLVWTGTTTRVGTYGKGSANIRGGNSVGATNYFNIQVRSHDYNGTNSPVSFSQTIDVSGITGNIYLSVYAYAEGGTDDNGITNISTYLNTTSIMLYA